MSIVRKIRRTLRGEVAPTAAARELIRRTRARLNRNRERVWISKWQERNARLRPAFSSMTGGELLDHFRTRAQPVFLPGFSSRTAQLQTDLFPEQTKQLIAGADGIVDKHSWPLLGIGAIDFGDEIDWHRDPQSGFHWPLEYHADLNLFRHDGSDARVLWELNRLPHFLTLARAYAATKDKRYAEEFFAQVEGWHSQNPYGMGVNWNCAMEVALRATNLLGAFEIFRESSLFDEQKLSLLLAMFDQHGRFVRENLEFSYVATSNHYLSDVIGLVWLGVALPELESSADWFEFGFQQMLREMDKQVLPDGADFESSTGYHRLVLELFLFTFILCRANNIEIEDRYWDKLQKMLYFVRAYLRPDGRAPLIGDSDSGQFFPVRVREGDDHGYLLPLAAVVLEDSWLKDERLGVSEELLWILGQEGVGKYNALSPSPSEPGSQAFADTGMYILRDSDLYLLFNATGAGINGRGSHGHNDALAVEVSACGRPFIVDPGTYVYTANLDERHLFRSTAYHSTIEIDSAEQNTTDEKMPFVIGNEAHPLVSHWDSNPKRDYIVAEHYGFTRLTEPVTHRRSITFDKEGRWWLIKDELSGLGQHDIAARFHFDAGLEVEMVEGRGIRAHDKTSGAELIVVAIDTNSPAELERQFISRDYLEKRERWVACWKIQTHIPVSLRWVLVPVCAGEDSEERLNAIISDTDLV